MWSSRSFQRHLCVMFLTSAIITSLFIMKNSKQSDNLKSLKNSKTSFNSSVTKPFFANQEGRKSNKSQTIHILGLFELTTKWGQRIEGLSEIAAAELAIRHVNALNILPDYTLKLIVNDTMVSFHS